MIFLTLGSRPFSHALTQTCRHVLFNCHWAWQNSGCNGYSGYQQSMTWLVCHTCVESSTYLSLAAHTLVPETWHQTRYSIYHQTIMCSSNWFDLPQLKKPWLEAMYPDHQDFQKSIMHQCISQSIIVRVTVLSLFHLVKIKVGDKTLTSTLGPSSNGS